MKLAELVRTLNGDPALPPQGLDTEVTDIAYDSRNVAPGSLFVAVRGFNSDGHLFISHAVKRGAVAVVAEHENRPTAGIPQIIVNDSRRALALLADAFYGHPSGKLALVGVTGTNGKTTTTYLVKAIIEAAGKTAGLIGTIDYRVGEKVYPAPNTTPESVDLQRLLAEMVGLGATHCVMEVSSHALELGRIAGCEFSAAAFTNLTQDHLDFHDTMGAYFNSKLLLFTGLPVNRHAVINIDDERGDEIIGATKAQIITTGMTGRAAVHPEGNIDHGIRGLRFNVAVPSGILAIESPLVGRHNISNILTAVGIATALGFDHDAIRNGIKNMKAVPGRMEKVDEGQPFGVVVDYAHTEDALIRLLEAARELTASRIITVFGCGGDRDRTKRPKMGAAALNGSNIVVVTSDNPRTEDSLSIIREIETGMTAGVKMPSPEAASNAGQNKKTYLVIPDRREAVAAAISMAKPGDLVVLAGKGHEDYQIIGNARIHFDDREAAREELRKAIAE